MTNFATIFIAARLLGPAGLGEIAVCLAIAYSSIALTRALVGEPTLVFGATPKARGPIGLALGVGVACSLLVICAAILAPVDFRDSLLALAAILPFVALQDAVRYVFFSRRRPKSALFSDLSWAAAQGAALGVAFIVGAHAWSIIVAWGIGAAAGSAYGLYVLHILPNPVIGTAWFWQSRRLSGWLALQVAISQVAAQISLVIVAGLVGSAGLGALRAGQALFAPLFLAIGLLTVVALPQMRLERGKGTIARGVNVTTGFSAVAAAVYAVAVMVGSGTLFSTAFGDSFHSYGRILIPLGLAAFLQALATGPGLGSRSLVAGRAVFATQIAAVVIGLPFVVILAAIAGVYGAAWGLFIQGSALCAASWFTYRRAFGGQVCVLK